MSKIKLRTLGKDPILENDIVETYIQVHYSKKITKDSLIKLFEVRDNSISEVLQEINDFFKIILSAFEHEDIIDADIYEDERINIRNLIDIIGSFINDDGFFETNKAIYNDAQTKPDSSFHPTEEECQLFAEKFFEAVKDLHTIDTPAQEKAETQSKRYAYLFIKKLINSPKRKLPPHIDKERFIEFFERFLPPACT